jgi:hypothetical protein
MSRTGALIFHAPLGSSVGERLVEAGRWASTRALVQSLRRCCVDPIAILTESAGVHWTPDLPKPLALNSEERRDFHFGRALQRLIVELELDSVLYFGSGSGGLLDESQLTQVIQFAMSRRSGALFNNFYSCDFAAIGGARELLSLALPALDNPLGFALAEAGIPCFSLPRSAATQFDIDTPTDVHLAAHSPSDPMGLRPLLADVGMTHPTLPAALELLSERSATTCLIGRVNPKTWSHFEREVACRTSGLVEGRGMRSSDSRRDPWLHQALVSDGPTTFFARLARSADAAWIDTRPLLSLPDGLPPADVRFASDLFRAEEVENPQWRAFTEEAASCRIPVVLGGHSLVSGGLYLAARACWKGRNLPRRLHPEPFEWQKESL